MTLIVIEGCPHADAAAANLTAALARVDVGDVGVHQVVIRSAQDASVWEFRGSPTLLLDGHDPFAGDAPRSLELSCRLYRTAEGLAGAPSVLQLVEALRSHAS